MKFKTYKNWVRLVFIGLCLVACEDFVEVDTPNHKLIKEEVFSSDQTALNAMTGIYNQLFLSPFSNGATSSATFLLGLSGDNLQPIRSTNEIRMEFEQHELLPTNNNNLELWSSAYNLIYLTNALLEGLQNSDKVSAEVKTRLEGEAKFIRAFTYFYLVNLYGEVPLILTTDYRENQLAPRDSQQEIYEQIIKDLNVSIAVLGPDYHGGERTQVNKYAAMALLARVYLYLEDWQLAEDLSSQVIAQSSTYELLGDLDKVFLANSREAIWQITPEGGRNISFQTNEGDIFIIHPIFTFFARVNLENDFVSSYNSEDKRLDQWINYHESLDVYYPFKYKIGNSNEPPSIEYSMVLRLAEQYLIRAEARIEQDKISEAIEDIDIIRKRAGLDLISEINPNIEKEALLDLIMEERRKELFTEWGHRWLDLKRTGRSGEVFESNNNMWQNTDVLYPIPGEERMKNPSLSQNEGY